MQALFAAKNNQNTPGREGHTNETVKGEDKEESKVVIEAPVLPPST